MRLIEVKLIKRRRKGMDLEFKPTIAEEFMKVSGRTTRETDRGTKYTKMATPSKELS